jgi:hypothetical protein
MRYMALPRFFAAAIFHLLAIFLQGLIWMVFDYSVSDFLNVRVNVLNCVTIRFS